MSEKLMRYLTETLPVQQQWVYELESQARADHVPIMDKVGIHFVMQLIHMKRPEKILEVGAAIGYSALRMLEANPSSSIVTIEKDERRYEQAMNHIYQLKKDKQIEVILGDALEELVELSNQSHTFDFIFIDAAKGQYQRFFELAEPMLNNNGIILSDNVLFRGYVADPEDVPKRYTKMVKKLRDYNEMLMNHPNFNTSIIPIGDGVAVSYKISE
ncbi:O-methyltransferase [Oceanobacillus sp. CF4.6]|uniref:O-methyltransferase n=1 Tax=Oceanobacillus sp. CF4.6 TaxID=3373080 RepID=UPI003EE4E044